MDIVSLAPTLVLAFGATVMLVAIVAIFGILFRRVVGTNMVHIVQSHKRTTSYGTGKPAGNVYYQWPSWVPRFGVSVIALPVNNFDIGLDGYEAYDKDRVPFIVDVVAFFRIADTDRAAQRVNNIQALHAQLTQIIQGAVRKVLAGAVIDTIMLERAQFGRSFTDEVKDQLLEWGIEPVKSMELMDIRDGAGSKVIHNIMAKKTSHIESESRVEVANNNKTAQMAEIEAKRAVEVGQQEAEQAVGQRKAEKDRAIGVANEQATQTVQAERATTAEREMAVKRVNMIRAAEIAKDQQVVAASQDKETQQIRADGALYAQQKASDGTLYTKKQEAEAVQLHGAATAEAERLMQRAPVDAQITLAKEIGENQGYQQYLVTLESVKAMVQVGEAQAAALTKAEITIVATAGTGAEGLTSAAQLFTPKGAAGLLATVEALANSPTLGAAVKGVMANGSIGGGK